MQTTSLTLHEGLLKASRLRSVVSPGERSKGLELAFLAGCGFLAAVASGYLDFRLRIPGHAILRAIFPMVFGLAIVPRRGAGMVMGGSALATALGMRAIFPFVGWSLGALTSLTLLGPLLDLSIRRARDGKSLYAGFALAGLTANLVAFFFRGGAKLLGGEHLGARPFSEWILHASFWYIACGLLAGLVSGLIWFQATRPCGPSTEPCE